MTEDEQSNETRAEAVAEQLSSEALVQTIDEKLKKMNRTDFLTISVNRTGLIVAMGILLILLWLLPVINFGLIKITNGQFSLNNLKSDAIFGIESVPPKSTIGLEVKPEIKLRIKTNNDSLSDVNQVEIKLRQAGFNSIETIFDPGITNNGILIVTREGEHALYEQILTALEGAYLISTESATLAGDSDFSAAILISSDSAISTRD